MARNDPLTLLIFGGACLMLASGCSSFRTELGRSTREQAAAFVEGESRVGVVLEKLGPPDSATRLPDGFAFLYEHTIAREFQLGISVNYSFLRYFKFIHAWSSLDQEAVLLSFNEDGVLTSTSGKRWKENLGGGSAVQFVVQVMSLSDASRYLRPADAHAWGSALLDPLLIGLNSEQSLRTGEHGLRQQRITPEYVGQHSLDLNKPKGEKQRRRIKKNYQAQPQPTS